MDFHLGVIRQIHAAILEDLFFDCFALLLELSEMSSAWIDRSFRRRMILLAGYFATSREAH